MFQFAVTTVTPGSTVERCDRRRSRHKTMDPVEVDQPSLASGTCGPDRSTHARHPSLDRRWRMSCPRTLLPSFRPGRVGVRLASDPLGGPAAGEGRRSSLTLWSICEARWDFGRVESPPDGCAAPRSPQRDCRKWLGRTTPLPAFGATPRHHQAQRTGPHCPWPRASQVGR